MSHHVLVVGKGQRFHTTEAQAEQWVCEGKAFWQKPGRRIKFTAGKSPRPKVRGLSCFVGESVAKALRDCDQNTRQIARVFLKDQFRKRETVEAAA